MEIENKYNPSEIENKWQEVWEKQKTFAFDPKTEKPYYYCLEMFPYPSGKIHMGHVRNYTIGDVLARYYRMKGFNVLHPIGWDAFGMPAENAAIKNKIHPEKWTRENIAEMRRQLKGMGVGYDWDREFATCDPEYYRWNQWFFIQMHKRGLIEYKHGEVNWCPSCQTVLANEQVNGEGECWRCSTKVEEKKLKQWFIKITNYSEELLKGHELLKGGWPEEILTMQKNWIGKSCGAEIQFALKGSKDTITVYTTRPDTLFGATFMVLAPEHPLVEQLAAKAKNKADILSYIEKAKRQTKRDRITAGFDKEGVYLETEAINPINQKPIPIYTADYVLGEYGFGAIMAVPAHDQRDYEFAKKYSIPIIEVIKPVDALSDISNKAYEGSGVMVNSDSYNGLSASDGGKKIVAALAKNNAAKETVKYRLKDWLISRQRYWGTPIPIVHCAKCGTVPVNEKDLPVLLPSDVEFRGQGESPLKQSKKFVTTQCPKCSGKAERETDTMDTFVDSSWYYARYLDPKNSAAPFSEAFGKKFLPVTQYIGGIEHACMHLIYARFFHKFMKELGLVSCDEPFDRLLSQGMVTLGGSAMSKSRGNIVEPSEIIKQYSTDAIRLFVLFASPPEKSLEWSNEGLEGTWRFLNRVWKIVTTCKEKSAGFFELKTQESEQLTRITHQTIRAVTKDLQEKFQFNTCIARLMEFYNALQNYKTLGDNVSSEAVRVLLKLLNPFAPHMCEELWQALGEEGVLCQQAWPVYSDVLVEEQNVEMVIQLNGKVRERITVPKGLDDEAAKRKVLELDKIKQQLEGKTIKKVIVIRDKLVNIVNV